MTQAIFISHALFRLYCNRRQGGICLKGLEVEGHVLKCEESECRIWKDHRASRSVVADSSASSNNTNDAIAAIEGALRIKDLWLPDDSYKGEHEQEAYALQSMYRAFLEVTQQQHH